MFIAEMFKRVCLFFNLRERETLTLTRGQTRNLGTCSDWESKWRSIGAWDNAQPPEPHQLGVILLFI